MIYKRRHNHNYMKEGNLTLEHNDIVTTQYLYEQLETWVQEGKKGIDNLRSFLLNEVDEDLIRYARMLYKEAVSKYFTPITKEEKYDYTLSKLITKKTEEIEALKKQKKIRQNELNDLCVQHDVDIKIFGKDDVNALVSKDVIAHEKGKIVSIDKEIKNLTEWISGAKAYIENEQYLNVSQDIFDACDQNDFTKE